MTSKRPTTIAEYIQAAPRMGQPHLRRLYAILKSFAPEAEEAIKWGTPFCVVPRFLFAFCARTKHIALRANSGDAGGILQGTGMVPNSTMQPTMYITLWNGLTIEWDL